MLPQGVRSSAERRLPKGVGVRMLGGEEKRMRKVPKGLGLSGLGCQVVASLNTGTPM